jgi:two-component system CheB/CheR fusion protein
MKPKSLMTTKFRKTKKAPLPAPREKSALSFPVVGIGASAGGLRALESFFKALPPAPGMAFVVVSHMAPSGPSLLPQLLQKITPMKVRVAEEGMPVQINRVYVIPLNRYVLLSGADFRLAPLVEPPTPPMSIDHFFTSLAEHQRENALGIVLSGTGTDGTLGLQAIKAEMGFVLVQEPDSAEYDGMPNSAILAGVADHVLLPEKMPAQLMKYIRHKKERTAPAISDIEAEMPRIFSLLRGVTGHDFSFYKRNTVLRRVERRMNVHQFETAALYVRYMQKKPDEVKQLFKELLIGVTNFFRDPEAFQNLKDKVLRPYLEAKPQGGDIRVWVPGCSTGEEAFSVPILLKELMEELRMNFNCQVFSTDLDGDAIGKGRAGIYPATALKGMRADRVKRFFIKDDDLYRMERSVREMLIFAPQNLIKDPPFTKLDLICCRNLLIYLDSQLQKRILPLFHYSLSPGGILFLGSSESIGEFSDLFLTLDSKWKIFKRRDTAVSPHPLVEFPLSVAAPSETAIKKRKESDTVQALERVLLERYVPASVLINKRGEIYYIQGRTGKYLEPASGRATLNILDMAREGLNPQLSIAIRRAVLKKKEVVEKLVHVKNGAETVVNIVVRPLFDQENMHDLLLVLFEEVPAVSRVETAAAKRTSSRKGDKRINELEEEIISMKDNLQSTMEEMETSNEELKAMNEEYQSTNEELRSANEELETSRDEMQSLNEELSTVNAELQGKINEISSSHQDLKHFMDSLGVPTIFVDAEARIKRFTAQATEFVNLIPTDIGRPIHHLVTKIKYAHLLEDIYEVLRTGQSKKIFVEANDGRRCLLRILPYQAAHDKKSGVVVTFISVDEKES